MKPIKKAMGIIAGAGALIVIGSAVWAVSSYWHEYKTDETIHEVSQDKDIRLAMNQSQLAIIQQRVNWLEQRIWEIEKEYNCPKCSGTILKTYKKYVQEYTSLQKKIETLTN